jgi:hypothetical protein
LTIVFSSAFSFGDTISYTGNFQHDDDVKDFDFQVASAGLVTLRTWSFAGGTNAAGTSISSGGFAPVLSLFDDAGDLLQMDYAGMLGGCGVVAADPNTGFCWDAFIAAPLSTGSYTLVLTEDDNLALGPTLADGFSEAGTGDFTGPLFLGTAGSFILADGSSRTSGWAVDITTPAQTAVVPEPGSMLLVLSGAGLLLRRPKIFRRRVGGCV